ncbi:MAG: hypothetical protein J7L88_04980, partial [Thermoplasmata archaeon]|nr:hypothetical protein [Thermoplasmata archaeon]
MNLESDRIFYSEEGFYQIVLSPGEKTSFTFRVRNTGSHMQEFQAEILNIPENWLVMFDNQQTIVQFSTPVGASWTSTVILRPSEEGQANLTIRVTSITDQVTENLTLKVLCENPAIVFETPSQAVRGPQGSAVEIPFGIRNTVDDDIHLNLSLDGILEGERGVPNEWVGHLSQKDFILKGGEKVDLTVTVFIPENATVNQPEVFSIIATAPERASLYRSSPINVNPQPLYRLVAKYVGERIRTFPGETINFTIRVRNGAVVEDTFYARLVSIPQGWQVSCVNTLNPLNQEVAISPKESILFSFRADLPDKVPAGSYELIVEFVGEANETQAYVPVEVLEVVNVQLDYGEGNVGGAGGYYPIYKYGNMVNLRLENMGNSLEKVDLNIVTLPQRWNVYFEGFGWGEESTETNLSSPVNTSNLSPGRYHIQGGSRSITIYLAPYLSINLYIFASAPPGTPPGAYHMAVKAIYMEGNRDLVLPLNLKLLLAEIVFEDLNGDGRPDVIVEPNSSIKNGDWVKIRTRIKNVYPYPVEGLTVYLDIGENRKVKHVRIDRLESGEVRDIEFKW